VRAVGVDEHPEGYGRLRLIATVDDFEACLLGALERPSAPVKRVRTPFSNPSGIRLDRPVVRAVVGLEDTSLCVVPPGNRGGTDREWSFMSIMPRARRKARCSGRT
jgi:hypothetical protein